MPRRCAKAFRRPWVSLIWYCVYNTYIYIHTVIIMGYDMYIYIYISYNGIWYVYIIIHHNGICVCMYVCDVCDVYIYIMSIMRYSDIMDYKSICFIAWSDIPRILLCTYTWEFPCK
jgi:hypothetical protein